MMDDLRRAIAVLRNPNAGWATRKETALLIGRIARYSVRALMEQANEADVDVRAAINAELARLPFTLPDGPHQAGKTLDELAQHCARSGQRTVTQREDGYVVEVRIDETRCQDVFIRLEEREAGTKLVRVFTVCGKPDASSAAWAMRANLTLVGCAFAVDVFERFEHLLLVQNFDPGQVTQEEVLASVKQIAFYGDWLEKRLTGEDQF